MPLLALQCASGHTAEQFVHSAQDLGAQTRLCPCGHSLAPTLSVGRGLTYFEEGRGFLMQHGVPTPVWITSHRQHERVMRAHSLAPAYRWTQGPLGH